MSRLAHAIGCCLLIAAPTGCAQQAAPAATGPEAAAKMDDGSTRVAEAAAKAYGWRVADIVVADIPGGSAGDCRLVGVRSNEVLSASTRTWAILRGGEVVAPGEPGALGRVLDACGDAAGPSLWADAIAAFADGVPRGRVVKAQEQISSAAHLGAVENGGYRFHPPRFAGDGAVEFLMTDVEGGRLFAVRGARGGDGQVRAEVRPAGGGG